MKTLFFCLLTVMILFSTTTALALEIVYPTLPGVEAPQVFMPKIESGEYTRDQAVPLYLKYFYVLFVVFSGLIAFAALAYGGFIFLISSGNPGKIAEAKEQIVSAFFGIIILLGSYMFLLLLNPNLIVLQVPSLQKAIFPPMPPISLPPQKTYTYWELPLGTIEEILLKKNEIAKIAALPLKDASIVVNQRTQELNNLLSQCKCSRLDSICNTSCAANATCAGTYTQLCPNATLIASARQELLSALATLKAKRDDLYTKTVALFKEDLRMRYTQSFLDNCMAEPYDAFTFIEMQEDKTIGYLIEKRKIWTDMNSEDGNTSLICSGSPSPIYLPSANGSCKLSNIGSTFLSIPKLSDLPSFIAILEAAAETFHVPPSLILSVMYAEGSFNPGKYDWTNQNVENWSCEGGGVPNCSPTSFPSTGVIPFYEAMWNNLRDAVNTVAPGRVPNPCNLTDAVFALTKDLSQSQNGSSAFAGKTCFGISLNAASGGSTDCSWDSSDLETAIRVWEFGTGWDNATKSCMTELNSCFTGGGPAAQCPTGGDTCETVGNRYAQASHNGCMWDVANHYK